MLLIWFSIPLFFTSVSFDFCYMKWKASSFGDCHLHVLPWWYFLINISSLNLLLCALRVVDTLESHEKLCPLSIYTCHFIGSKLTWPNNVYHFWAYFFLSPCSPSMITIGHFAAALPFNKSCHCLLDNRMNEWLSVLVAATAYPIR